MLCHKLQLPASDLKHNVCRAADAFIVALTRCSGIILGVFLSVLLAVLIFPKSASHQATDNLSEALQAICELSQLAWHTTKKQDIFIQANASAVGDAYLHLPSESSTPVEKEISADQRELECERASLHYSRALVHPQELT